MGEEEKEEEEGEEEEEEKEVENLAGLSNKPISGRRGSFYRKKENRNQRGGDIVRRASNRPH